jgi:hypothetical protein
MVGLKSPTFLQNWLSADDVWNLLHLADWEVIKTETRILWPVRTPVWSWFCNRWLAPLLPPLCVMVGMMARPKPRRDPASQYRCSAVIPTRNEAGNIEEAVRWPGWGSSCKILENSELGKVTKRSTTGPLDRFRPIPPAKLLPSKLWPRCCGCGQPRSGVRLPGSAERPVVPCASAGRGQACRLRQARTCGTPGAGSGKCGNACVRLALVVGRLSGGGVFRPVRKAAEDYRNLTRSALAGALGGALESWTAPAFWRFGSRPCRQFSDTTFACEWPRAQRAGRTTGPAAARQMGRGCRSSARGAADRPPCARPR